MNLVAKEFVASRAQNDGVLILSRFAGAAQQLSPALLVNPYDIEQVADAIKSALKMPLTEQTQRMTQMRQSIANNNVYLWAADLLKTMVML
jgi:trehalose-6-phosphate synthase